MASTPTQDPKVPASDHSPVERTEAQDTGTGSTQQRIDQHAVAASTKAANAAGGQGAQPGGQQDPPLI